MNSGYEMAIGLEVHVELATRTKIFCNCSTEFGCPPNTNICPVCMGMPGTLPVLNKEVVNKAIAVGIATNCKIADSFRFDRKNYFYPDNPQNYQISQLYEPICKEGYIEIGSDERTKKIRIHEIHMEEDAGKLIHQDVTGDTLVDYNRAGVPLIEIVTEPDMSCPEEVNEFLDKLRLCIQYIGASDCKLNEGSMRVDVNLSVRPSETEKLGTRTEMKNLNSFRAIGHAIENEAKRQVEIIESGQAVELETRRWDEDRQCSYPMRSKEDSKDYRYFPEPDIPPVEVDSDWVKRVKDSMPELRDEKKVRYKNEYSLPDYDIDIITGDKRLVDLFETAVSLGANPKKVSNWIMGETLRIIREHNVTDKYIVGSAAGLARVIELVDKGVINGNTGKTVYEQVLVNQADVDTFIEENGLKQISDSNTLTEVIREVLTENPQSVTDYQNGKVKAIGFLVGQTMKKMGGKASPTEVNRILTELLSNV